MTSFPVEFSALVDPTTLKTITADEIFASSRLCFQEFLETAFLESRRLHVNDSFVFVRRIAFQKLFDAVTRLLPYFNISWRNEQAHLIVAAKEACAQVMLDFHQAPNTSWGNPTSCWIWEPLATPEYDHLLTKYVMRWITSTRWDERTHDLIHSLRHELPDVKPSYGFYVHPIVVKRCQPRSQMIVPPERQCTENTSLLFFQYNLLVNVLDTLGLHKQLRYKVLSFLLAQCYFDHVDFHRRDPTRLYLLNMELKWSQYLYWAKEGRLG